LAGPVETAADQDYHRWRVQRVGARCLRARGARAARRHQARSRELRRSPRSLGARRGGAPGSRGPASGPGL